MERIFNEELRLEHGAVVWTEAPLTPKANREKLVQIMFEIDHFFILIRAIMFALEEENFKHPEQNE